MKRFSTVLSLLVGGLAAVPLAAQAGATYETKFIEAGDPAGRSGVVVHGAQPDTAEVMAAAESCLAAFNNLEWEAFHGSFARLEDER